MIYRNTGKKGVFIAILVLGAWLGSTYYCLQADMDWLSPWPYLLFLLQTHLYTGLFITAHDAMHGAVASHRGLNHGIGRLCAALFAFNAYSRLIKKHHQHHRFVATPEDPDYHEGNFWLWYASFVKQYVSLWQILWMALAFNLLILFFPEMQVLVFWALPSVLSTFQLFYFGTYLPHRGEHAPHNEHKSRSQPRNHLWAFLSCYFFGYHYEHHASPATPWWLLHKVKDQKMEA